MRNSFSLKIFESCNDIRELEDTFDKLRRSTSAARLGIPSLQEYWLMSFLRSYGTSRDLALTVVYKQGDPQLLMPLQLKGTERLEFLCDETSDYNDFILCQTDTEVLKYALKYWASQGISEIRLDGFPSDSQSIDLLNCVAMELHWKIAIRDWDFIPIVVAETDTDIQDWHGVKNNSIRRYKRKLSALHQASRVAFSLIQTTQQLTQEFPAIRELHISRWKAKDVCSKYSDRRREQFILDVCYHALQDETLFFPVMKIDGLLAAFIIGFKSDDVIFDWNTSFSLGFSRWSPGALLLLHILSHSREFGFTKYNLMKGMEDYKSIWTDKIERNKSVILIPS